MIIEFFFFKDYFIGRYIGNDWSVFGFYVNEVKIWNLIMKWLGWFRCEKIVWSICRVLFRLDKECLELLFFNVVRFWIEFFLYFVFGFS